MQGNYKACQNKIKNVCVCMFMCVLPRQRYSCPQQLFYLHLLFPLYRRQKSLTHSSERWLLSPLSHQVSSGSPAKITFNTRLNQQLSPAHPHLNSKEHFFFYAHTELNARSILKSTYISRAQLSGRRIFG